MSMNVKIIFGPYESHYSVRHKKQRMRGLINALLLYGYRVELIKSSLRNLFIVEMCDKEVFRCDITNLQFNTDYRYDPVCWRAITAIREATLRFQHSDDYDWVMTLVGELVWKIDVFKSHLPEDKTKHGGRFTSEIMYKKSFSPVNLAYIDFIGQFDSSDEEVEELSEVVKVRRQISNVWRNKNLLFVRAPDRYALVLGESLSRIGSEFEEDFSSYPGGEELNKYVQERRQEELGRRQARLEEALLQAELYGDLEDLHMARRKKIMPRVFSPGLFIKDCRCNFCVEETPAGSSWSSEAIPPCIKPPNNRDYY